MRQRKKPRPHMQDLSKKAREASCRVEASVPGATGSSVRAAPQLRSDTAPCRKGWFNERSGCPARLRWWSSLQRSKLAGSFLRISPIVRSDPLGLNVGWSERACVEDQSRPKLHWAGSALTPGDQRRGSRGRAIQLSIIVGRIFGIRQTKHVRRLIGFYRLCPESDKVCGSHKLF